MRKVITVTESALTKGTTKEIMGLTTRVKTKIGEVGKEGVLKGNIFYRILKNGFMIF